jgi:hypothetical protein
MMPSIVADSIQLGICAPRRQTGNHTIPVIMVTQADPVALGLINGLGPSQWKFHRITSLQRGLAAKRVRLALRS